MRAFTILAIIGTVSAIRLTEDEGSDMEISAEDIMDWGFDQMDSNGDGELDFDEGMSAAKKMRDVAVKRGFLEEGELDDEDLAAGIEYYGGLADGNGNGKLCKEEMGDAMGIMMEDMDFDEEDLAGFAVEFADEDGNGEVCMDEARSMLKDFGVDMDDEDLERAHRAMDHDGSGGVSADELLALAQEGDMEISAEDIMDWGFDQIDDNGDGELDFDEGMAAAKAMRDAAVKRGFLEEGEIDDDDLAAGIEYYGGLADGNGNGKICREEMNDLMGIMMEDLDFDEEDLADFAVEFADEDGNGEVCMDEARSMLKDFGVDMDDEDLERAHRSMDHDGSGGVSADELLAL